jgi:glycine betaine/proline transport system ATP-binding protein
VADFVNHMNPLGVLTARDAMEPGAANGATVAAETPIRDAMEALCGAEALTVTDAGQPIGRLTREGVLTRLLNPRGQGENRGDG